jgi:hypothetical protein
LNHENAKRSQNNYTRTPVNAAWAGQGGKKADENEAIFATRLKKRVIPEKTC